MCLSKSFQKNFATPKTAVLRNTQFFLLAKKHILLHIFVKVKAIDMKLKTLLSDVNQRLCAKFGANWAIGGAINTVISSDKKVARIHRKFGERDLEFLPSPAIKFCYVWSKWA